MTPTKHASTFVISLTPFDAQDRLDEQGLRLHLRRIAAAGVGVYLAGGGSGEGYTLTQEETRRILEIGREELKGKVPVRAMGVEPRSAKQMVDLGKLVESVGLDTMQLYSVDVGHANKPNDRELETYFRDILDRGKVRCVISTHQSVGYFIPLDMLKRLVTDYPQVIGINCTNPDVSFLARLVDLVGDRVELHVGGPAQGLTALALGATGFLTSEANLAPRLVQSVITQYKAGEMQRCFEAFGKVLRLSAGLYKWGSIRGTKAALGILGLPGGYPRRPRLPAPDAAHAELAALLDHLGIRATEGLAEA